MFDASTFAANSLWIGSCAPAWISFQNALRSPEQVQRALLDRLLRANAGSAYGRAHGFDKLRSAADFQSAVPMASYDDLASWIERVKDGEPNVLTRERVLMFEKTSGSSSAAKFIPYTATLRREFQSAIRAWMFDLYSQRPRLLAGKSYWSITPLSRSRERTRGGLPVGFESDTEYLGGIERALLRHALAVPDSVARIADFDASLDATIEHLSRARSLAFISIWNPSFLTLLVDRLGNRQPRELWPNLQVISCWTDAAAAFALPALRERFPGVEIQGKGLLATEGVVSIPLVGKSGAALALTSHFFEFVENERDTPKLAHELERGREYSVLLTTGGGLWRYRLGDRVRAIGFEKRTPLIEFIGKEDAVSDLCGEKLNAIFVADVLTRLREARLWTGSFAMLAPVRRQPFSYALFVEGNARPKSLAAALDQALRANPHYDYCRCLGQLGFPQIFLIHGKADESYVRRCESLGQRAGSVKSTSLHAHFGWEQIFRGRFVGDNDDADCKLTTLHV